MISIDSIGALIKYGYGLSVHCYARDCWNYGEVDLAALAARLGENHSHLHDAIKSYFRCSKCGSKDIGFRLSSPHNIGRALENTHIPVSQPLVYTKAPEDPVYQFRKRKRRQ